MLEVGVVEDEVEFGCAGVEGGFGFAGIDGLVEEGEGRGVWVGSMYESLWDRS